MSPPPVVPIAGFIIGAQSGASKNHYALRAARECVATRAAVRIERGAVIISHLIARFGAEVGMRFVASQG